MLQHLILLLVPALGDEANDVFVETASLGRIRGRREGGVDAFRGLKYATNDRFAPAAPYVRNASASYDGRRFGAWCYQASFPEAPDPRRRYSEDCLFLNVWRPAAITREVRPVLVYVHGGGFTQGSGSDPLFDGARLAAAEDSVVVTLNYRLGPLGFLVLDGNGRGGMNGISDVVEALKWVQTNSHAFGGGKVTLFGESAGGCATV